MAREQAGEATPIDEFAAWRARNRLSLSDAALALGIRAAWWRITKPAVT